MGLLASIVVALAAIPSFPPAPSDELTDLDRKVLTALSAQRETPRALFHFEPDAITPADLDAAVAANVAALVELEKTLALKYRGRVHFFLYRSIADMTEKTGAGGGTVAFSTGTVSVHQAHDFRGCHELVHIYALQFPPQPDGSGCDGFVVEGLATALAESDEGIPIAAWATAYAKLGVLPDSLQEFRRKWSEGAKPGVHPYHVAGAFVGWLVEQHGIAKVKQWYVDSTEAHRWFGKGFGQLEREWREAVAKRPLAKEQLDHVKRKLGITLEPLPDAWAKAKGKALLDAKDAKSAAKVPASLTAERPDGWKIAGGMLVGANDESGTWSHLATASDHPARIGVRATIRLVRGNAVKLRLSGNRELILAVWSSFLSAGAGYVGNDRLKIVPGRWYEVVLVNDGGRARAWL